MTLRSWLMLIVVSLLGYAAAFLIFPKVMPAAHWNHNVDRDTAVALAKKALRDFGVDGINWDQVGSGLNEADVSSEYNRRREFYLGQEPNGVGQPYFTPLDVTVKLIDFKTHRRASVTVNSKGRLLRFEVFSPPPKKGEDGENDKARPTEVSDADKQLAETTAKTLWGEAITSAKLTEANVTRQGSRFVWKTEDPRMKLLARVLVRDGKIKQALLEQEFTRLLDQEFEARRSMALRILSNSEGMTIWLPIFLVAIFYFVGIALNRIQHKQALIFLAAAFVLVTIYNWLQGVSVTLDDGMQVGGGYWSVKLLSWLFFLLGMLFVAGSLYFVWAAGQSLAIRIPNRPTISLELILKGKLLTKPVARSIAIGVMSGGILVALPFLLAVSRLIPGMELDPANLEDHFVSSFPSTSAILNGSQYLAFVVFGFLAVLIQVYVKRPTAVRALVFVTTAMGLLGTVSVSRSVVGLIVTALMTALALTALYFRSDLLAVIISLGASQTALNAAAMLAQPSASLKSSGWKMIGLLTASAAVGLIGAWKFREVAEEETAVPLQLLQTRDERERLKAEFSVAQRAQQQMLPDAPPQIPGLEIAAICKPSKEVGGDLYDFISLSDGRLGIVVADVSGKGVPASLYMTLTKGLLESVSENTSDPGEILREVNRHLYEVCRRKMFVTLFLGVIDPATKQMAYARAGHNPTVFRCASRQETSLLRPKGMGLGLNGGKTFNQSLQVATLQLEPEDKLFFYSDGITEAMNPKNEEYGEERLMEIAAQADAFGATEARDAVLADVTQFLDSNAPQDDQTLVVVKIV
ncbi:MAG TPA: PP2C family protein-serine/threonine phosphatase [Blastocatellia bacterium]|nr:PP2C family protein-serine/threonine phosphatase [Blastocatellia bacterium]HMZ19950.1 PP2C family protein-serine/threonine phosphatase [Blastocatellia bacterium]HNG29849.1 PP2C family protein-serine/threonine phosphatase [Blastocatellia bacterium]